MKTPVSILFMFRRSKHTERAVDGLIPVDEVGRIVCRVQVRGKSSFHSLNLETPYGEWDAAAQRVRGKKPAAQVANAAITKLRDRLTDIWADLERQSRPVTAQAILRIYAINGALVSMTELYEAFLAERKQLVGIEIAPATCTVAKVRQGILVDFLQAHRLTDLRPEEFNHNLADRLLYWMLKERDYKRNYANKVLQTVGQALRWAVKRELLTKNPMEGYEFKAAPAAEIKHLTVGELQDLTNLPLPHPYLRRVRDCYVFQCWTGLAYGDLAALNVARDADYHKDGQGNLWRLLRGQRAKSTLFHGYEYLVPLLPEAERILALYADKLPVISNANYNGYLKEVGQLCGLPADKMTTHVARKTAGVMMLNLGIRMETVSKFLGHSSVRMTEKLYAKILDTTVIDDFSKLFGSGGASLAPTPTVYALPALRMELKGGTAP